jgi:hypothetical protein
MIGRAQAYKLDSAINIHNSLHSTVNGITFYHSEISENVFYLGTSICIHVYINIYTFIYTYIYIL